MKRICARDLREQNERKIKSICLSREKSKRADLTLLIDVVRMREEKRTEKDFDTRATNKE